MMGKRLRLSGPVNGGGGFAVKRTRSNQNLQEYLQTSGYTDKDQNENTKGKRFVHSESSDSEDAGSFSSRNSSKKSKKSIEVARDSATDCQMNSLLTSPLSSKRPIRIEIVGSSSSELETSGSSDTAIELPQNQRKTRHGTGTLSTSRTSSSSDSSRASVGLISGVAPDASSAKENVFPTPPSSSSSSSTNSGDGDDDDVDLRPSTRSKLRSTTTSLSASARPGPASRKKKAIAVANSGSISTGNNDSDNKDSAEAKKKAAAKVIHMTPELHHHIEKYRKMALRVELTCIDDNGEMPVRPTFKPKSADGEEDSADPDLERPQVKSKPLVGRFQGERHLIILPSLIHGKGLFTANSIKAGEMIIEYAGEVVSAKAALQRQNWYDRKGIDNYVMNIGRELHIDATNEGNCSRYINHSCEPNCAAEILTIRGDKRVLIIAQKDIVGGQELTYDYRFTSDELVPCFCNTASCRLFLNHNVSKLKLKKSEIEAFLKADREQRRRV